MRACDVPLDVGITKSCLHMNFVLIGFCGVRQVAYYGRGDEVVEYFSDFGMHCSPHYNPADFISTCIAVYTVNPRIEVPGFYQHK